MKGAGPVRNPTILMGLGSGQEAWLIVELGTLRFRLEIENGKSTVESLTLDELKTQYPRQANLLADVLAEAVRADPPRS